MSFAADKKAFSLTREVQLINNYRFGRLDLVISGDVDRQITFVGCGEISFRFFYHAMDILC
jgi:hypothetical protein